MRETPETLTYAEHLPAVYRFAFLMTGSVPTAAEVLRLTVEQAERGDLSDVHDPRRVKRWLFARARSLCARPLAMPAALEGFPGSGSSPDSGDAGLADSPDDTGWGLSARFAALPEPERSAAILFYLYLFEPEDLAATLNIRPVELAGLLTRGRGMLQKAQDSRQKAEIAD